MCRLIYLRSILFLMYHKDNFTFFSKGKKYYFTDSEISLVSGITAFVFFKSVLTCHATASCYLGVDRLVFSDRFVLVLSWPPSAPPHQLISIQRGCFHCRKYFIGYFLKKIIFNINILK